jgi:hypothetical protein
LWPRQARRFYDAVEIAARSIGLDGVNEQRMLDKQRCEHGPAIDDPRLGERRNEGPSDADVGLAIEGGVKAPNPTPHGGVNVEVYHRAQIALPRINEFEPALPGVAWRLAVTQGDQLADFLVEKPISAVAGCMCREPKRLAVGASKDVPRRDMIPILAIASNKVSAAQVAERKVLDAAEIP